MLTYNMTLRDERQHILDRQTYCVTSAELALAKFLSKYIPAASDPVSDDTSNVASKGPGFVVDFNGLDFIVHLHALKQSAVFQTVPTTG